MRLNFIAIAGALLLGIFIGHVATKPQLENPKPVSESLTCEKPSSNCAEFENLKSHLEGVSPEQIQSYLRAQSLEEKLKKADEILSQIMKIFVADIGYRLRSEDMQLFGQNLKAQAAIDTQPPPTAAENKSQAPNPKDKEAVRRRLKFEVRNARSESEAMKALAELGTNYNERIQNSGTMTAEEVRALNGHFEGTVIDSQGKSPRKLTLDFQARLENGKVMGSASVQLFGPDGRPNSQSRGKGNLNRDFYGNDFEVFVQLGSQYLQLVYFPSLDLWMGNLLDQNKGNYIKVGSLVLQRS